MAYREIESIERLEMLEERLGISLNGVSAEIGDFDDDMECVLVVRGEVVSLDGGGLEDGFYLKMSAFNSRGKCVGVADTYFSGDRFFGIDIFELKTFVRDDDVQKIRVIATKF